MCEKVIGLERDHETPIEFTEGPIQDLNKLENHVAYFQWCFVLYQEDICRVNQSLLVVLL